MHENRETSSLTESAQQHQSEGSPAGKGQGRNPSTNKGEESDRAEVPMKPVNKAKEQQAGAAEQAEGRARAKENIRQSNIAPAQDGQAVSQGLTGVRRVTQIDRKPNGTTIDPCQSTYIP